MSPERGFVSKQRRLVGTAIALLAQQPVGKELQAERAGRAIEIVGVELASKRGRSERRGGRVRYGYSRNLSRQPAENRQVA